MTVRYRCWAEVDLMALRENLAWIRHRVGPEVRIMTVVKADAYGHGLRQIATLLMQSGTDIFGVANLVEAQTVRQIGPGWPVLMLGACLPEEIRPAVRDGIMPTISSFEEAKRFSTAAGVLHKTVPVHIKIDTGMGRLGVSPAQAGDLVTQVQGLPGLKVQGIYTHYSAVEDDLPYSRKQRQAFQRLVKQLLEKNRSVEFIHANNSGALLLERDTTYNLIRPGLLVYGIVPRGQRRITSSLQKFLRPALTWKCRVGFVKEVAKGASLSYGRTFIAPRSMRVATLTAGYGDGYMRAGSNRAHVLIGGKACPVVGRVTMDQMLADVSRVKKVQPGDDVVLLGQQGSKMISASQLAEWFGTVPWEVLTNISYRVPRIYRGGHAS